MFYKKFCQFLPFAICIFLAGCNSVERNKCTYAILLESSDSEYFQVAVLPMSCLRVQVAPVPIFTESDISNVAVRKYSCGYALAVTLANRAAYDMRGLSIDALGRKLIFERDGEVIGFSIIDAASSSRELLFIPEISDGECCNLFCQGRK
jgi:hypothetical protein